MLSMKRQLCKTGTFLFAKDLFRVWDFCWSFTVHAGCQRWYGLIRFHHVNVENLLTVLPCHFVRHNFLISSYLYSNKYMECGWLWLRLWMRNVECGVEWLWSGRARRSRHSEKSVSLCDKAPQQYGDNVTFMKIAITIKAECYDGRRSPVARRQRFIFTFFRVCSSIFSCFFFFWLNLLSARYHVIIVRLCFVIYNQRHIIPEWVRESIVCASCSGMVLSQSEHLNTPMDALACVTMSPMKTVAA